MTVTSTASSRIRVLGAPVDNLSFREVLATIEEYLQGRELRQHIAVNVHKIVMLHRDAGLAEILDRCDLTTADGQAVRWAARLLGKPIKERIAGIDLMEALLGLAAQKGYRVYFLGAPHEVVESAVEEYRRRYPGLCVSGWADGYWQPSQESDVVENIRNSQADLLFVALNSPRKELFIHEHRNELGVRFAMGVGGAFEVASGLVRRAPVFVQQIGCEWLWRILQDPIRLSGRYLSDGSAFLMLVVREWVTRQSQ